MIFAISTTQAIGMGAIAAATPVALTVNQVARQFFYELFLFPERHATAVLILCGATVLFFAGLIFGAKKLYERYNVSASPASE